MDKSIKIGMPASSVAGVTGGDIVSDGAQPGASAKQRMIDELQETNGRLQTVMNAIEEHINIIAPDGEILWHNQGRNGHSAVPPGAKCWKIFENREARCPHCVHPEMLRDGKPRDYETRIGLNTAHPSDWWVRAVPLRNNHGEIYAILESAIDITERKRIEASLRQVRKMDAIGQLAGGIAHDFNNLLQSIQGNTELAVQGLSLSHPVQANLGEVTHAASRAKSLVRQLLTFSRRDIPQYRQMNLNQVIDDLSKMLGRLIGEQVVLKMSLSENLGTIFADEAQIEQILINLHVNARDAMPQGGTLTIETANVVLTPADLREHVGVKPGAYVMLRVSDTGVGMDADTQERMYEPFFSTKGPGQNPGLGLATVFETVQQHQGLILHRSAPGEGTVFRIYFPVTATESKVSPQAEPIVSLRMSDKQTILLAEDEESVRKLASIYLGRAGFHVLMARDGQEAIDLFNQHYEEINIAVLDVVMPLLNGWMVAREFRTLCPTLPIIFSTGYDFRLLPRGKFEGDHIELLAKPYHMKDLLSKVDDMLAARNEPQVAASAL